MQNFEFYAPTRVIFGKDTHKQVGAVLKEYGFTKILLHYGRGSVVKSGLLDTVREQLREHKIDHIELAGAAPNPKIDLVREGAQLCRKQGIELVLAIGGGSVIDSSKAIAAASKHDFDPWKFFTREEAPKAALPVGVILTIAASGSETSSSSVVTNPEGALKRSYHSKYSRPLISILDPVLTYSVSLYQTACGIADIMMHTMERYFSPGSDTALTDRMAEGLLKAVMEAGETVVKNPRDYDARATLMWAGSLSHNDLTGLGRQTFLQCHQLEHELSGMYDEIAHGAGLCAIFPAWMRYVAPKMQARFLQFGGRVLGLETHYEHPERTVFKAIDTLEQYFVSIGMPVRLSELHVNPGALEELAQKCTHYGKRRLSGNVELDTAAVLDIFRAAM